MPGNGNWQKISMTMTLSRADNLWLHLYGDMFTSTSANGNSSTFVDYDDVSVKKGGNTIWLDGFESSPVVQTTDPNSSTSWYTCDASLMVLQTTSSDPSQWKRDVIYVAGRALAEIDANGIHELHTDHLGTPRVITAGSTGMTEVGTGAPIARGHVEARQAFAPYGELITNTAWTNGYVPLTGYTGHVQQDPTGLIYMRGRYYSPAWHRFLNSDKGVDTKQLNQFAYVGGSPLQATDPSGLMMGQPVCKDGFLIAEDRDSSGKLIQTYVLGTCNNGNISISSAGKSLGYAFYKDNNGYHLSSSVRIDGGAEVIDWTIIWLPQTNQWSLTDIATWSGSAGMSLLGITGAKLGSNWKLYFNTMARGNGSYKIVAGAGNVAGAAGAGLSALGLGISLNRTLEGEQSWTKFGVDANFTALGFVMPAASIIYFAGDAMPGGWAGNWDRYCSYYSPQCGAPGTGGLWRYR